MGYHLNRLDEPVFIAASKPLLTKIGIHHRLESCEIYLECVPLMFVGGADTELVNNIGRRPIHIASDSESLQLLLDHGARVDAQVRRGDCYSFKLMLILNEFQFMVIRIESETLPSTLPFCPRTATVWTFC